jgi:hypothetical protein
MSAEREDVDAGEDAAGLDDAAGLVEAWRAAAVAGAVHSVRIGLAAVAAPCLDWHWGDTSRD